MAASVESLHIAGAAGATPQSQTQVELAAGRGIVGDRYYTNAGTFSPEHQDPDHELTLIEVEKVEAFNQQTGGAMNPGDLRRNIVTRGVDLNSLVGKQFKIGPTTVVGIRFCEPCSYLAERLGPNVVSDLVHKAGLRAGIVEGGTVRVGDAISVIQDS